MNVVVVVGGGIPASLLGGYLSDKLEGKLGNIKGLICGVGALSAIPFIFLVLSSSHLFGGQFAVITWHIL